MGKQLVKYNFGKLSPLLSIHWQYHKRKDAHLNANSVPHPHLGMVQTVCIY